MAWLESKHRFRPGAHVGWEAARLEFEHQAEHLVAIAAGHCVRCI